MTGINRRIAEYREVTMKVVSMLAERSIRVTQQGQQAYVEHDPRTGKATRVNLPFIPDDATDQVLNAVRGFLDHEVAHVLFTDVEQIQAVVRTIPVSRRDGHNSLAQVLEDTLIERKMIDRFPGSLSNLQNVLAFVAEKVMLPNIQAAKKSGDQKQIAIASLVLLLRSWSGQRHAHDLLNSVGGEALMGKTLKTLLPFKHKVASLQTSGDVARLALQILDVLENPPPDDGTSGDDTSGDDTSGDDKSDAGKSDAGKSDKRSKPDKSEDAGDEGDMSAKIDKSDTGSDEGDAGKGKGKEDEAVESTDAGIGDETGESNEDDDGEGDDSEDGGPEDRGYSSDDTDDTDEEEDDDAEMMKGESTKVDVTMDENTTTPSPKITSGDLVKGIDPKMNEDALNKALSRIDAKQYMPFSNDFDKVERVKLRNNDPSDIEAAGLKMDTTVLHMVGQMQNRLQRLFAQQDYAINYGGQRSGRVQASALHRLSTGDNRVFTKREQHTATDTAVYLLLDFSGSMSGTKLQTACQAAYALSKTLDRLNISYEIAGFTTTSVREFDLAVSADWKRLGKKAHKIEYSRTEPIHYAIIKSFAERASAETRSLLAGIGYQIDSCVRLQSNVDGECVKIAADRLAKQTERRKVLLVLSDGQPSAAGNAVAQHRHLRDVTRHVQSMGIEAVGIGIRNESVRSYYPKYTVIRDVNELPTVVMREMEKILLRQVS